MSWTVHIDRLEVFFKEYGPISDPIQLDQCTKIIDSDKFIKASLATVKSNNGNKTFLPYIERLIKLKKHLEIKK